MYQRKRRIQIAICSLAACAISGIAALPPSTPANIHAYADTKAEGAELFGSSGCAHCHGALAQGAEKGPTLRNARRKMNAEQMHKQIAEGGATMPAFGDSLDSAQIDKLVEALRDKHLDKLLAAHPAKP